MKQNIAIYILTENGLKIAAQIQKAQPEARLFISDKRDLASWDTLNHLSRFSSLSLCTKQQFSHFTGHIFICALGIVSRVIAPHIRDKRHDPAIICIDEQGKFAISVLSGHRGGANKLTKEVSALIGATPVITTASDVSETLSADTFAEHLGWKLDPDCEKAITRVSAAIVNQKKVALYQEGKDTSFLWRDKDKPIPDNIHAISDFSQLSKGEYEGLIIISHKTAFPLDHHWKKKTLLWHPDNLVFGIGCDKNTPLETLEEGISLFCKEHKLSHFSIRAFASIDLKKDEPGIKALANRYRCPFHTFKPHQLNDVKGIEHPSEFVKKITGSNSVAEAAALVESKTDRLLIAKWKYKAWGYNMTLSCCLCDIDKIDFDK